MDQYYKLFTDLCNLRKIQVMINERRYLEMREEYLTKIQWWPEVQKCVNWLYDHEKKTINSNRLRNWVTNAIKYNKEKEIKLLAAYQDKKVKKTFNPEVKPKRTPVWEPPC